MRTRTAASGGASRCGCARAACTPSTNTAACSTRTRTSTICCSTRSPSTSRSSSATWRPAARWTARGGAVRAWSAGCASGEEPYTVAVALAETARRLGQEALLERARVDATDIDRVSLERTRAPAFPETAFSEMPAELGRRYFTPEPPRRPLPELQRLVHVAKHDLTSEPPPDPPYDLIVCRNVVIYFDRPMQERLFAGFADALVPGGVLLLLHRPIEVDHHVAA